MTELPTDERGEPILIDTDDTFADLDDWDNRPKYNKDDSQFKQKMLCPYCKGAGCIECGQSGSTTVNPKIQTTGDEARAKRREAARKGRETKLRNLAKFWEDHYELLHRILSMTDWNDFARSLMQQASDRPWSEKQLAAAERMVAKLDAKKEKERSNAPVIEFDAIRNIFETAVGNGYKRPTYRAEDLVISRAPDNGSNPGALYVKYGDEYQGKIVGTRYFAVRSARPETEDALMEIAKDPLEAAVRWGRRTGRCSCCGRELTNHESIELGIGPICREKWGM